MHIPPTVAVSFAGQRPPGAQATTLPGSSCVPCGRRHRSRRRSRVAAFGPGAQRMAVRAHDAAGAEGAGFSNLRRRRCCRWRASRPCGAPGPSWATVSPERRRRGLGRRWAARTSSPPSVAERCKGLNAPTGGGRPGGGASPSTLSSTVGGPQMRGRPPGAPRTLAGGVQTLRPAAPPCSPPQLFLHIGAPQDL